MMNETDFFNLGSDTARRAEEEAAGEGGESENEGDPACCAAACSPTPGPLLVVLNAENVLLLAIAAVGTDALLRIMAIADVVSCG